jgi:hypothetical protein
MDTQTKKTSTSDLSGNTTIVIGASRGLGREIARAFADAGAPVVADADATRRWRGACWTSTSRRYSSLSPAPTRSCLRCKHHTWETFSVNRHRAHGELCCSSEPAMRRRSDEAMSMPVLHPLVVYALPAALITMLPGPDTAMVQLPTAPKGVRRRRSGRRGASAPDCWCGAPRVVINFLTRAGGAAGQ